MKDKIQLYGLIAVFFSITIIFFGPIEIILANRNDFQFSFADCWYLFILAAILFIVVFTLGFLIISIISSKLSDFLSLLLFSFTLEAYIQAMLLNGKMPSMAEERVFFPLSTQIVNLIFWIILFSGIFILKMVLKASIYDKAVKYVAVLLSLMQMAAFVFLCFTTEDLMEVKSSYVTKEGMLELSKGDNTVVFILDTFGEDVLKKIEKDNPDVYRYYDGFVNFSDAISFHSRTYPSIVYLLTGKRCYYDEPFMNYVNKSYEDSTFIDSLIEKNIDVGLYTYNTYIGNSIKDKIRNIKKEPLKLNSYQLIKKGIKMVLYRDMPYIFKKRFFYEARFVNEDVVIEGEDRFKIFQDEWFENELLDNGLVINPNLSGTFRFYHLGSYHLGFQLKSAIFSLEIINDYISQLKELGIYDNTTIIITADHGTGAGIQNPIMFLIKPQYSNGEIRVNAAPISQSDFIGTVKDSFNIPREDSETSVFDFAEGELRTRYYYRTELFDGSDLYGETKCVEYEINGKATDESSYKKTGNEIKIEYSENRIHKDD